MAKEYPAGQHLSDEEIKKLQTENHGMKKAIKQAYEYLQPDKASQRLTPDQRKEMMGKASDVLKKFHPGGSTEF